MDKDTKQSLALWIIIILVLSYFNIPQWLLCYPRESFILRPSVDGYINSIIFLADKEQKETEDIRKLFDDDAKVIIDSPKKITQDSFAVIQGISCDSNNISISFNNEPVTDFVIEVDRKRSNAFRPTNYLIYNFRAKLSNFKTGENVVKLKVTHKKLKSVIKEDVCKIIMNNP